MEIVVPESTHFRNFVAILFAMVLGVIVVGTIESIGHLAYPPPADLDMTNAEEMEKYIATVPVQAMLFVIFAWSAGIFSGCVFAGIMGAQQGTFCCLVYSLIFTSMVIAMLFMVSSPVWFSVAGLLILAPSAFAGWASAGSILTWLKSAPVSPTPSHSNPDEA